MHKDLIVGEQRSARLLAVGVSEVNRAMQTGFKKIYSDPYGRYVTYTRNRKGHVSCSPFLNIMHHNLPVLSRAGHGGHKQSSDEEWFL